jgi:hypothetical protein
MLIDMAGSGMVAEQPKRNELGLLELATFVMTCARTCIDEGQRYAPLRFFEIFRRISDLASEGVELHNEPILIEISSEMNEARDLKRLDSDEQRIEFTNKMIRRLTAELKKRAEL